MGTAMGNAASLNKPRFCLREDSKGDLHISAYGGAGEFSEGYTGEAGCAITPKGRHGPLFPQSPTTGSSSTPPRVDKKDKSRNTVVIFDWDDTLLCSSAINATAWGSLKLDELEQVSGKLLQYASWLGETLVVTNGNESWVKDSSTRLMPGMLPVLRSITTVSARAGYERKHPGNPFAWKHEAFRELLSHRQGNLRGGILNLIVVGDSLAEVQAARSAAETLHIPSFVKTVKFKEAPSLNELLGQLRRVHNELFQLVSENRSSTRVLEMHKGDGDCSSWASAWKIKEDLTPQVPVFWAPRRARSPSPKSPKKRDLSDQSGVTDAGARSLPPLPRKAIDASFSTFPDIALLTKDSLLTWQPGTMLPACDHPRIQADDLPDLRYGAKPDDEVSQATLMGA